MNAPTKTAEDTSIWRPPSVLGQSFLQAGRLLRRWRTYPPVLIQTFMFPVVLFVMFRMIFGESIEISTGSDNIAALTAVMAVCPAMFGGLAGGLSLVVERNSGLLRRFDSMPVPRGGDILGRAWAEMARMACATVVVLVVAHCFGFRFADLGSALGWLTVLTIITAGFTAVGLCVGALSRTVSQAEGVEVLYVLFLFLNTGMVPLQAYPTPIQSVVDALPVSAAVNALSALSEGTAGAADVVPALLWFGGLALLFGTIAVTAMRTRRG